MNKYAFKPAARVSGVSADDAGRVFEELEATKGLTPANVVDVSRPESAPLHAYFEWNDGVAAEKYREVQAGNLIRAIVTVTESSGPVRAFVSVTPTSDETARQYVGVSVAISTPGMREQLLADAYSDAAAFRRKYAKLSEMASVIQAIDGLGKS